MNIITNDTLRGDGFSYAPVQQSAKKHNICSINLDLQVRMSSSTSIPFSINIMPLHRRGALTLDWRGHCEDQASTSHMKRLSPAIATVFCYSILSPLAATQ